VHLREVHPGKADSRDLAKAERAAATSSALSARSLPVRSSRPAWVVPLVLIVVAISVVTAIVYLALPPPETDVTKMCVNHSNVGQHKHANLRILILGTTLSIPEGIGIEGDCMHPLHTHAADGVIHIEGPAGRTFTLGNFVTDIWGKPLNATCIMTYCADSTHDLVMTVDGAPSTEFGDLVLGNGMDIVIEYRLK